MAFLHLRLVPPVPSSSLRLPQRFPWHRRGASLCSFGRPFAPLSARSKATTTTTSSSAYHQPSQVTRPEYFDSFTPPVVGSYAPPRRRGGAGGGGPSFNVVQQQGSPCVSRPPQSRWALSGKPSPPNVTVVDNEDTAAAALEVLLSPGVMDRFHACDTEVVGFDVKSDSTYTNDSNIICASIYVGPDVDFGGGPRLWIDNLDGARGTLDLFKEAYFENERVRKVWHNYSFDRGVLWKAGINVVGFGGDTMHMARLWDSSRTHRGGYSLEALTTELLPGQRKTNMKDRFGRPKIKVDGTPGKEIIIPALDDLQRGECGDADMLSWVDYSTYDTEGTWRLRERLQQELEGMPSTTLAGGKTNQYEHYVRYWLPFGEMLTDMERQGVKVDTGWLKDMQRVAERDSAQAKMAFLTWAEQYCSDARLMNPGSDAQKRQLFFAPAVNRRTHEVLPDSRVFKMPNDEGIIEPGKSKPLKNRNIKITGLGMPPEEWTTSGWPAVGAPVLRKLAGDPSADPPQYGSAYSFFDGQKEGKQACEAISSVLEMGTIDTLLSNFIIPLQHQVDQNSRVHASLNINTETGRLSCRRPNLQNQPALEKDRYKIRKAFTAEKGNKLIVSDYGQLELRVLAHMANCKSMIEAFEKGGDFHSRTAMGMYPHVREAVDREEVLLEWDPSQGVAHAPLLKDKFAMERRRAKVLNFSIAYGKTAVGLSKDWGVTLDEAKETLELWFSDRPEVLEWQKNTIAKAHQLGYTETLMGRRRPLPEIHSRNRGKVGHAERASINTPIQGGAADIVMAAMLKVHSDQRLRDMGWRQVLQVHDELILEGPEESVDEALLIVSQLMEHPFDKDLRVALVTDPNAGDTWIEAK